MSGAAGDPEATENFGANTDQDGATAADKAENAGANTQEDDVGDAADPGADAPQR